MTGAVQGSVRIDDAASRRVAVGTAVVSAALGVVGLLGTLLAGWFVLWLGIAAVGLAFAARTRLRDVGAISMAPIAFLGLCTGGLTVLLSIPTTVLVVLGAIS